jgi:hypothetical protein
MKHRAQAIEADAGAAPSLPDGAGAGVVTDRADRIVNPSHPHAGPERRRRRVYVTRNTEYHVEDGTCVAVRNRRTQEFVHGHLALERRVEGALKFFSNGSIAPNAGEPQPGESLYFANEGQLTEGRDLVTSPLESVARPDQETIGAYPTRRKR